MRAIVIGGGIAGLAAAYRLESLLPEAEVTLVERTERLGGMLLTDRTDGFVIEGAPDSFLSRKARGIGLCEELGLVGDLVGRKPENARSYVRWERELHPLPEGLTGMIPTDLDLLAESSLLSQVGRERLATEVDLPAEPSGADESIASFVTRRLGAEAYERLVEPLMTGIYGGDGAQLSLQATFPNLRGLELEHGSLLRGLSAQSAESASPYPPFVTLAPGMQALSVRLAARLRRTRLLTGRAALGVRATDRGYEVTLDAGERLDAEGVVVAVPAFAAAELLADLEQDLAAAHSEIPYSSSAVISLGYPASEVTHPLDGYGYVVPRAEGSDVLACTWTSSKWEGRAPAGSTLIRVYAGRFDGRDVTADSDEELVALARDELRLLGIEAEPDPFRVHRWPRGMPQYILGHPERIERIESAVADHPGLALAGSAYRGVGIPDCIHSGEEAARSLAESFARLPG
ncbi:MAG: protoporphyrinogen oxidase [Actinomycetota bacterium]|nr:protoporphyrinogen oxidase [Actinomycetota bacterium]